MTGVRYKNGSTTTDYYFVCNWRGDVIRIYDGAGAVVANYNYDAWGNVISVTDANGAAITDSTHIANVNPLRYRGYYFDSETGFYYVSSRYYDPEIGRWINADSSDTLTANFENFAQYNVFAYCFNNSVNMCDLDGFWAFAIAGGGYLATAGTIGVANAWNPVGWVIVGTVAIATVTMVGVIVYTSTVRKNEPDSYARPGQKKQGREHKNKARKNKNWNQGLRLNLPKNTRRTEIIGSIKNAYLDTYQLAKES